MYCHCRLLYRWNHRRKGEEMGGHVVHDPVEVQYHFARSQTIIWQMFGIYVYSSFCVVTKVVSDVSPDAAFRLREVNSLLMKIHFLLAKRNVATMLICVSMDFKQLIPLNGGSFTENAAP
jgi:hypothetical protein